MLWLILKYRNIIKQTWFERCYSGNNLHKIKDRACVINLDECKLIGTHWTSLYVNGDNVIYFENFGVEYILKEMIQTKIN